MGRTKCRTCPDCSEQVSSYSLICSCGGSLAPKRHIKETSSSTQVGTKRRRTERTQRGKPNYYDALEYTGGQSKKEKKRTSGKSEKPLVTKPSRRPSPPPPPLRMQLGVKKMSDEPEVKEEDLEEIVVSEEKLEKFSQILSDINRKIAAASWKGIV